MKTIILFIILSIITLAQTDIRVKGELVSVKQAKLALIKMVRLFIHNEKLN